jgi:hypothetical protein
MEHHKARRSLPRAARTARRGSRPGPIRALVGWTQTARAAPRCTRPTSAATAGSAPARHSRVPTWSGDEAGSSRLARLQAAPAASDAPVVRCRTARIRRAHRRRACSRRSARPAGVPTRADDGRFDRRDLAPSRVGHPAAHETAGLAAYWWSNVDQNARRTNGIAAAPAGCADGRGPRRSACRGRSLASPAHPSAVSPHSRGPRMRLAGRPSRGLPPVLRFARLMGSRLGTSAEG